MRPGVGTTSGGDGATEGGDSGGQGTAADATSTTTPVTTVANKGGSITDPATGPSTDPTAADEASAGSSGSGEADWLDDARSRSPSFRSLYDGYLEATCAGFENVCHSNSELPDLTAVSYTHLTLPTTPYV